MALRKQKYNRIKVVLAENDKTNLWLSDQLKVNKTTVSKWCTNDAQPTIETLFKIAQALKIRAKDLLVDDLE